MSKKKKVLIIDDEEDTCLLLKRYLSRCNCEVYTAYSLKQGLEQLSTLSPDILFLDNNLPDGFGWDQSTTLLNKYPKLELHLISAYDNQLMDYNKEKQKIKVWQKPFSLKKLDEVLQAQAS
jgi:two-component system OmpR family response regulator